MFAEQKSFLLKLVIMKLYKILPFFHQLQPQFLCLIQANGKLINIIHHFLLHFARECRKCSIRP